MRAIQNALLNEFESLCQKLLALLSNIGIFYHACSPNIVISRDQEANFPFFLFCLNSTFNIRKSHQISGGKALYFRSYQPKTSRELEIPSAFRVNGADFHLEFIWLVFSVIDNTAL